MGRKSNSLLQGTLEALILKSLSPSRRHGYGVGRWIEQATDGVFKVEEGSLYPALYRMEKKGWIEADWDVSELGRKAKFYHLTDKGTHQLELETERWQMFSVAISKVLLPA